MFRSPSLTWSCAFAVGGRIRAPPDGRQEARRRRGGPAELPSRQGRGVAVTAGTACDRGARAWFRGFLAASPAPSFRCLRPLLGGPRPMSSSESSSRRDFLQGKAAARALLDQARAWTADPTPEPSERTWTAPSRRGSAAAHARVSVSRRAMACEFSVEFHAVDGKGATSAALAGLDRIDAIESQLTVYRDASEVLDINATAHAAAYRCEPGLYGLLEQSLRLAGATDGAFDITSGPLSRLWGFFQRQPRLPSAEELAEALASVDYRRVQLDPAAQSVRLLDPRTEINFNAIGKGHALDHAAAELESAGIADFLLQGGSSSVLVRGVQRDALTEGWLVGIPHPFDDDSLLGEVRIVDRGLGTAGGGTQFFEVAGRRYGHVLDPRTGWPAEGVLAATAIAPTAAEADALATAFAVMGPGAVAEFCAAHRDYGAVMACPGAGTAPIDVHVFNLTPDQWRPA